MNKRGWLIIIGLLLLLLAACGGSNTAEAPVAEAPTATVAPTPAGDARHGEEIFEQTCIACHGPGGSGIEGLGKDMTTSDFIREQTDEELVSFLKVGRDPSDPSNSTGIPMPPKGGNPALMDDDLQDIVAYIRSLQK